MTGTSRNFSGMDSWSTLAIPRPMRMTRSEPYGRAWVSSLRWDDLNTRLHTGAGCPARCPSGDPYRAGRCWGHGRGRTSGTVGLGETPNIAARIARTGRSPIRSLSVKRRTAWSQGYFTCQDLGAHALVVSPKPSQSTACSVKVGPPVALMWREPRGLTPLVGRESEVTLLLERWEQAKAGKDRSCFSAGEAGIGKSPPSANAQRACGQRAACTLGMSEFRVLSAYGPVSADRAVPTALAVWQPQETPDAKLAKLEQHAQPVSPAPRGIGAAVCASALAVRSRDRYPPLNLSPQRQRQKTLETIVAILLELAERQPVLFIVEDLHWTDPSTPGIAESAARPDTNRFPAGAAHLPSPFSPCLAHRSYLTEMTLNHLSHAQVEQMCHRHDRWENLPSRGAPADPGQDGWRAPICRGNRRKPSWNQGMLRDVDGHYALAESCPCVDDSRDAPGRAHGAARSARRGQGGGATRGGAGADLCLCAAAGGGAPGRASAGAWPGAAGAGRGALPAGRAAARHLYLQACPRAGDGLSVAAAEHAAAVSSAHGAGVGGALSRPGRDPARAARPPLHRGRSSGARPALLAAGRRSAPLDARPIREAIGHFHKALAGAHAPPGHG